MNLKDTSVSSGRSIVVLFAVAIAFVLFLALLDWWTYPRIARNEFHKFAELVANKTRSAAGTSGNGQLASRSEVKLLKPLFPKADTFTVIGTAVFVNHPADILKAASGKIVVGYAIDGYAMGYHGVVHTLVTTGTNFKVRSVQIVSETETVGYSERFESRGFLSQFLGKTVGHLQLGSGIDAVTGATVSCRAVANGVATAVDYLRKYVTEAGTGTSTSMLAALAPLPVIVNTSAAANKFHGKDGTLSIWHREKGVGCQLCHIEKKPPYSSNVPTKTCLSCHENGFSNKAAGEKMLAEVKQQLAAAPGGKAMIAAVNRNADFPPAQNTNNHAVMLRLRYMAIKDIEDSRPLWAKRAIYEGEPADPHISHLPIHNCTLCHHIHKKSQDRCGTRACHPNFHYKMR